MWIHTILYFQSYLFTIKALFDIRLVSSSISFHESIFACQHQKQFHPLPLLCCPRCSLIFIVAIKSLPCLGLCFMLRQLHLLLFICPHPFSPHTHLRLRVLAVAQFSVIILACWHHHRVTSCFSLCLGPKRWVQILLRICPRYSLSLFHLPFLQFIPFLLFPVFIPPVRFCFSAPTANWFLTIVLLSCCHVIIESKFVN